jgi:hypothetical protein
MLEMHFVQPWQRRRQLADEYQSAILKARRRGRLTALSQLRALGILAPERVAPYILLGGHAPDRQLRLF